MVEQPCDPEKWRGTWYPKEFRLQRIKEHGFFHEGIWNGRSTMRSDGIDYAGNYSTWYKSWSITGVVIMRKQAEQIFKLVITMKKV